MKRFFALRIAVIAALITGPVLAQSSSLYVDRAAAPSQAPLSTPLVAGVPNRLSPEVSRVSFSAARMPQPKQYALHDLVTIIVREDTQAGSDASLDTNKEANLDAKVSAFPNLRLDKLFKGNLSGGALTNAPQATIDSKNEFKGDGKYARKDTFTSRLTAEVIDVKPNGTLVLEARKFIKTDDESLNMVITGTCRAEDVTIDNTVLSTQLHDLSVVKENTGELRNASKKGIFTKIIDTIFNF